MNPQITRALLATAALTAAYVFLSRFGLGFIVIVALVGYLATLAIRHLRSRPAGGSAPLSDVRSWLAKTPNGQEAPRSQGAEETQARRERERREMDCGLTHQERELFREIVRGADGSPQE